MVISDIQAEKVEKVAAHWRAQGAEVQAITADVSCQSDLHAMVALAMELHGRVDVLGLYSLKLDGGRGTGGTQLLPLEHDGRPADEFGRLGVAFKAKISKTELKVGEWMPVLPILRADDGRSLPQTLRGGPTCSTTAASNCC